MNIIQERLLHFEARLQSLVEGSAARLFPGRILPSGDPGSTLHSSVHEFALRLEEAMRTGVRKESNGDMLAPNLYILLVHEQHTPILLAEKKLMEQLAKILLDVGLDAGYRFIRPPVVQLAPAVGESAENITLGDILVIAKHSQETLLETSSLMLLPSNEIIPGPKNAYLIIDGTRIFPLDAPVINIGRREDNQLVIDDSRISRLHAQIRIVRGRYVIFDLESLGGTWVNGQRIQQFELTSGDVVSLAGVPIVYGQDDGKPPTLSTVDETREYVRAPNE